MPLKISLHIRMGPCVPSGHLSSFSDTCMNSCLTLRPSAQLGRPAVDIQTQNRAVPAERRPREGVHGLSAAVRYGCCEQAMDILEVNWDALLAATATASHHNIITTLHVHSQPARMALSSPAASLHAKCTPTNSWISISISEPTRALL